MEPPRKAAGNTAEKQNLGWLILPKPAWKKCWDTSAQIHLTEEAAEEQRNIHGSIWGYLGFLGCWGCSHQREICCWLFAPGAVEVLCRWKLLWHPYLGFPEVSMYRTSLNWLVAWFSLHPCRALEHLSVTSSCQFLMKGKFDVMEITLFTHAKLCWSTHC